MHSLPLWFFLILNSSHKILRDSSIIIEKASIYAMNALKKLSELWHSSSSRKGRPRIAAFQYYSSKDHGSYRLYWTKKNLDVHCAFRSLRKCQQSGLKDHFSFERHDMSPLLPPLHWKNSTTTYLLCWQILLCNLMNTFIQISVT